MAIGFHWDSLSAPDNAQTKNKRIFNRLNFLDACSTNAKSHATPSLDVKQISPLWFVFLF